MTDGIPRKGERTRRALLAAARRVFAEKGFLETDIADIARAAGKSRATFYTHLGDKTQLLLALVAEFRADRARIEHVTGEQMFRDRRRELRAVWDLYRTHAPTLDAVIQAASLDPNFAAEDRDLFRRGVDNNRALFRYMQSIGRCRRFDADRAGEMLATMITAVMLRQFSHETAAGPPGPADDAGFETLLGMVEAIILADGPQEG